MSEIQHAPIHPQQSQQPQQPWNGHALAQGHNQSSHQLYANSLGQKSQPAGSTVPPLEASAMMAATNSGSNAAMARRRISRACDQCNQFRTRCDGKLPCKRCSGECARVIWRLLSRLIQDRSYSSLRLRPAAKEKRKGKQQIRLLYLQSHVLYVYCLR